MKKLILALAALILIAAIVAAIVAAGLLLRGSKVYEPAGEKTGVEALDDEVLSLLQEVCDPKAADEENAGAVYDWIAENITYRPGTADTSGGFTDELTCELAQELLEKRKGNCDGWAALLAVLLRRMGWESQVVTGQFLRAEDGVWVDHAWVAASLDGVWRHFDPLYGHFYAEDPRESFWCTDAELEATHEWDRAAVPACE